MLVTITHTVTPPPPPPTHTPSSFSYTLLLHLSGNLGHRTYLGKATTAATASATQSYKCMLVFFFRVSLIHRTLTRTTGSLACVCDHSHARVYTRGLGTPTVSQCNLFGSEKRSQLFLVLLMGFKPRFFESRVRRSARPANP